MVRPIYGSLGVKRLPLCSVLVYEMACFDTVDTRDALLGASVSDFDNCMITRAAYCLSPPPVHPLSFHPEMHENYISY